MSESAENVGRGRHRTAGAEPELPFPGGIVANVIVFALLVVIAGVVVSALSGWPALLAYAVPAAVAFLVSAVAGLVEHRAESHERRARSAPDAVRRVEPRSDAERPVALRSDWTLPSQTFYRDARTQARLDEARVRRLKALAAAVVLLVFFAGVGSFLSYVTHGTSHGCVDCDSTGGQLTSWGFLIGGWVSAVFFPWQIWRSRDDETR